MSGGYTKKLLTLDLSSGAVRTETTDEAILRKFISGRGLGVKLLYDRNPRGIEPFSPDNLIVLTTGVLGGTTALFSSRVNITTKSPLTGLINMGNTGGFFGPELKFAGFDGLVITGKAEALSYIWIKDGRVEVRTCEDLKGKSCPETEAGLRRKTDMKSYVLCIGPAGEKLVKTACVYGEHRFIGRGGTGAVFASKNLKGVVVRGSATSRVPVSDEKDFSKLVEYEKKLYRENEFFRDWAKYGTPFIVSLMNSLGILGTHNYQHGGFDDHESINGDCLRENYIVRKITCHRCPVACISLSEVTNGRYAGAHCRGPEYETIYAFGSDCGNSSLPAVIMADQLCTEYGMDTISTGNICAFTMELFERGVITRQDTGGLSLRFGNHEAMIELIHLIGKREGIGDVLAEGVRRASESIGKGAEEYAMHVKGLELAGYDPRGAKSQGIAYATSPRGGCHHTGYAEEELYDSEFDRFTTEGKPAVAMKNQDKSVLYDSTGICSFPTQLGLVNMETMADLLYCATGFEEFRTVERLIKIGERAFNLERLFNWQEGMTPDQDTLPGRFLREPLESGASAGHIVEIDAMLKEYYTLRKWTADGRPTEELLEELGLSG
jgi:aldehyde:ferredoxin oxidoreductase